MTNKYSTTLIFGAAPSTIYGFYTDVTNWRTWDNELEYSSLDQEFTNNSKGKVKPKGNAEIEFTLQNVELDLGFDQVMNLPFGSKFILTRRIKPLQDGSEVTHSGYFEGVFGAMIGVFLKAKYTLLLAKSVQDLKQLCESKN